MDKLLRELGNLLQLVDAKGGRTTYRVSVGVGSVEAGRSVRSLSQVLPERMIDVFDEDDHYRVIAELPGIDEAAVRWSIRDNRIVTIRTDADGHTIDR